MEKMREIKFRAWDNRLKYMISPEYGNWISFDGVPYEEAVIKYNTPHTEIEKSKDLILMQFTGLKDKNGKEIYEGDITYCLQDGKPFGAMERIEFTYGRFILRHRTLPIWDFLGLDDSYEIEIIGNVYNNPELLNSQPN